MKISVRNFTREPSTYIDRVAQGESFELTRYGKPVAIISSTSETAVSATISTQVEHTSTAPTHRPAPEPLEVKGGSWADRNPKAAATDAILGASRARKR